MGQLVVAIAGGIIGSVFGMPQLGFLAGSLLGAALFPQKSAGGKQITDLKVTSSTYGMPIPRVWGTLRLGGNIIYSQDIQQHKSHSSIGKGGQGQTSYTYSWAGAVGLCVGPVTDVIKIWADTKLVYDKTGASGNTLNVYKLNFRLYKGTETQTPDPIGTFLFGANAQSHRGMAYIVFDNIPLLDYGNRVPNWTFEVVVNGSTPVADSGYGFTYDQAHAVAAPDGGTALVDWDRNRVFLLSDGEQGINPTAGLRGVHIDTGAEYIQRPIDQIYPAGSRWIFNESGGGACLGKDGFIYLVSNPANTCQFAKIDPESLTAVAYFGTASSSLTNNKDGIVSPGQICSVQVPSTGENFITVVPFQAFRGVSSFNADIGVSGTMTFSGISFPTDENAGSCCSGPQTATTAIAYISGKSHIIYSGLDTTPIGMYVMTFNAGASSFDPATYPGDTNPGITFNKVGTWTYTDVDPTSVGFTGVYGPVYDPTDGNVLMQCTLHYSSGPDKAFMVKIDMSSSDVVWATQMGNVGLNNGDPGLSGSRIINGTFSILIGGNGGLITAKVYTFNTIDGSVVVDDWGNQLLNNGQQYFNESTNAIVEFGGSSVLPNWNLHSPFQWGIIYAGRVAGTSVLLSTIVSDICGMVSLQPSDIDVSDLTDVVPGYIMSQQMTAKDAIAPLALVYFFDGFESDFLLKFIHRGHASVVTIPASDLARIETQKNSLVQITRVQEVDLPVQVSLTFLDPNNDYQAATAYTKRPFSPAPTMYSNNILSEDVPIALNPLDAKQACERTLYSSWINRLQYKVKLPWQYLVYDPTDVAVLHPDTQTSVTVRLASNDVGVDYSIDTQAVSESGESYTNATQPVDTYNSNAVAYGGDGFVPQQIRVPGATKFIPMDTPLLQDTDDTGQNFTLIYYAGGGYDANWPGMELHKSVDQVSYVDVGGVTKPAAWGSTTTALGDPSDVFAQDNTNTVTVAMTQGGTSLASITNLQMLNGGNGAVLLKANGEVEVFQFQTVTQNLDGTFTLSVLLRGRRGTDTMAHTHLSGETFVLLTPSNGIGKSEVGLEEVGALRYYKPVTTGALIENAPVVIFTSSGRPLRPYAPTHVTATLSGSDIDLAWVRRTRLNGEMHSGTGIVPLAETTEAYDVDIYDALGVTVLRTLSIDFGSTPTATPGIVYTAAEITADFGSTPTSLTLEVYQKSGAVGRGFAYKVTVPVM